MVELARPGSTAGRLRARVEQAGRVGHWFPWARLTPGQLGDVAVAGGFKVEDTWEVSDRWFGQLRSDEARA
jgi:hypothetical protein